MGNIRLIQSQIFGVITFSYTDKDFRTSKWRCAYNIAAIAIYFPLALYGFYKIINDDSKIIYKTTDAIILVGYCIYIFTIWIYSIINRCKFIELLMKIIDFDAKLQTFRVNINYEQSRIKILREMIARYILLVVLIVYLSLFAYFNVEHHEMFSESMSYFLLIVNSAVCHQVIEIVLMIKRRFAILNKQIHKLIQNVNKIHISVINNKSLDIKDTYFEQLLTLNKICTMHHQLSKLIKLINEIFGVILLLMFGVGFVTIVVSLFYCTANLQATVIDWLGVLSSLSSSVTFIIDTIYVCHVCYSTIEEANKSGELIHKIETEDHDIRDEIEMFSLQIANEQVEFNAAGFFPVNYTLLFSIIGGATTYIIILIQLSSTVNK